LLNYSDAILKSQSLSNTIMYKGYKLSAYKKPPYPEGVFDKLTRELNLTS